MGALEETARTNGRGADALLSGVALSDGRRVDIEIRGAQVAAVLPAGSGAGERVVEADGGLCVRPLTDAHLHLDKAGTVQELDTPPPTIAAAIEAMNRLKQRARTDRAALVERMSRTVERLAARGTRVVRADVDVDGTWGLTSFEAACQVRERFSGRVDIKIVAFPQEGVSATVVDLLIEATRAGADAVGAHTDIGDDPEEHLKLTSAVARQARLPLEVHVDEAASPDRFLLPATLKAGDGIPGLALVHCLSLGLLDEAEQDLWIERIRRAGAVVVVAPSILSFGLPIAPVARLLGAGVPVVVGSDNLQDVFVPLGTGSVLDAARTVALVGRLTADELVRGLFRGATDAGFAAVTGDTETIEPGTRASLTVFSGGDPRSVLGGDDDVLVSLVDGRIVEEGGR